MRDGEPSSSPVAAEVRFRFEPPRRGGRRGVAGPSRAGDFACARGPCVTRARWSDGGGARARAPYSRDIGGVHARAPINNARIKCTAVPARRRHSSPGDVPAPARARLPPLRSVDLKMQAAEHNGAIEARRREYPISLEDPASPFLTFRPSREREQGCEGGGGRGARVF